MKVENSEGAAIRREYSALRSSRDFTWQLMLDYKPSSVECPRNIEPLVRSLPSLIQTHESSGGGNVRCASTSMHSFPMLWVQRFIALENTSFLVLVAIRMFCAFGTQVQLSVRVNNPEHARLLHAQLQKQAKPIPSYHASVPLGAYRFHA